jgi:hypothetical protein
MDIGVNEMKKLSYIALGIIIGIMLSASVGVYAANNGLIGEKVTGEISVFLDGKAAPNSAIVVDNKSYLPVRWTADSASLGLELKDKKIYLTTKQKEAEAPSALPDENSGSSTSAVKKGADGMQAELSLIQGQLSELNKQVYEINKKASALFMKVAENPNDVVAKAEYDNLLDQGSKLKKQIEDLETRKATLEAQK